MSHQSFFFIIYLLNYVEENVSSVAKNHGFAKEFQMMLLKIKLKLLET